MRARRTSVWHGCDKAMAMAMPAVTEETLLQLMVRRMTQPAVQTELLMAQLMATQTELQMAVSLMAVIAEGEIPCGWMVGGGDTGDAHSSADAAVAES